MQKASNETISISIIFRILSKIELLAFSIENQICCDTLDFHGIYGIVNQKLKHEREKNNKRAEERSKILKINNNKHFSVARLFYDGGLSLTYSVTH